jgi:hypothetical protein
LLISKLEKVAASGLFQTFRNGKYASDLGEWLSVEIQARERPSYQQGRQLLDSRYSSPGRKNEAEDEGSQGGADGG